jgi:hypothetical protein
MFDKVVGPSERSTEALPDMPTSVVTDKWTVLV